MFLLANINDRRYSDVYSGVRNVAFDMNGAQLANARNQDWAAIRRGSIVCVVNRTRRISTFRRIEERRAAGLIDPDSGTPLHIIIGPVVGKLPHDIDMTTFLNQHGITHPYLPGNKFSIGFNVANLGDALNSVVLKGGGTPGDLERSGEV